jgi:Flp pilus assembly pilin Flp
MLRAFWKDEAGFIISTELVLVATICVIGLITGLVEVQYSLVGELNDVSESVGALNQTYTITGFTAYKTGTGNVKGPVLQQPVPGGGGMKAQTAGSIFHDHLDACDDNECTLGCDGAQVELKK